MPLKAVPIKARSLYAILTICFLGPTLDVDGKFPNGGGVKTRCGGFSQRVSGGYPSNGIGKDKRKNP
ncbi:hypothetical protein V6M85_00785 [Sulfolobus tengchongensis]|uniref:Uncharacterized protein n=1 Tax=Sulfolobus tengchongensis TaxID=207809 RepID=A0AAX4L4E1_9CREN